MTIDQYRAKMRQMAAAAHDFILKYADRAVDSGAFDLESEPNNFSLPKNVTVAALEHLASPAGWGPTGGPAIKRKHRKQIRSITANTPSV